MEIEKIFYKIKDFKNYQKKNLLFNNLILFYQ